MGSTRQILKATFVTPPPVIEISVGYLQTLIKLTPDEARLLMAEISNALSHYSGS